jgi:hypothetical protein
MKRIFSDEHILDAIKPLYGSKGRPPYYDPNDLHSHVWHNGKLGIEDNPKIPTYSKNKMNIKDCTYCKICHKIKDPFQSTVGKNIDIVNDLLVNPFEEINKSESYNNTYSDPITCIKFKLNTEPRIFKKGSANERLFLKPEGIFNNYIKVEDVKVEDVKAEDVKAED